MTKPPILAREARLARARGILADREGQSDARLRRACLTILNIAPHDDPQRAEAERLRKELTPTN